MEYPLEIEMLGLGMYRRRLIDCVFFRGWSTLKCAREIGADPNQVLLDFNEATRKNEEER
jgi:hypothetical protein